MNACGLYKVHLQTLGNHLIINDKTNLGKRDGNLINTQNPIVWRNTGAIYNDLHIAHCKQFSESSKQHPSTETRKQRINTEIMTTDLSLSHTELFVLLYFILSLHAIVH